MKRIGLDFYNPITCKTPILEELNNFIEPSWGSHDFPLCVKAHLFRRCDILMIPIIGIDSKLMESIRYFHIRRLFEGNAQYSKNETLERIKWLLKHRGAVFQIHHGWNVDEIAYTLVKTRKAIPELITTTELRYHGKYDMASLPCKFEKFEDCFLNDNETTWKDCSKCPERKGSLPIAIEVGGITSIEKLVSSKFYEIWLANDDEYVLSFRWNGNSEGYLEQWKDFIDSMLGLIYDNCPENCIIITSGYEYGKVVKKEEEINNILFKGDKISTDWFKAYFFGGEKGCPICKHSKIRCCSEKCIGWEIYHHEVEKKSKRRTEEEKRALIKKGKDFLRFVETK